MYLLVFCVFLDIWSFFAYLRLILVYFRAFLGIPGYLWAYLVAFAYFWAFLGPMPIYLSVLIQQTIRAILAVFQFRRRALVISGRLRAGRPAENAAFMTQC